MHEPIPFEAGDQPVSGAVGQEVPRPGHRHRVAGRPAGLAGSRRDGLDRNPQMSLGEARGQGWPRHATGIRRRWGMPRTAGFAGYRSRPRTPWWHASRARCQRRSPLSRGHRRGAGARHSGRPPEGQTDGPASDEHSCRPPPPAHRMRGWRWLEPCTGRSPAAAAARQRPVASRGSRPPSPRGAG